MKSRPKAPRTVLEPDTLYCPECEEDAQLCGRPRYHKAKWITVQEKHRLELAEYLADQNPQ